MPTYAELSVRLLLDTATFFRTLAEQNPDVRKEMANNAGIFEQTAKLMTEHPTGTTGTKTNAAGAAALLRDAAAFFRTIGAKNPPIQEQMDMNAQTYELVAAKVEAAPTGIAD